MCCTWTVSSVKKDSTCFATPDQSTAVHIARQLPNTLVNSFNDCSMWEAERDRRESSICFIIIWAHAGQSQSIVVRGLVVSDSTEKVSMCTRSLLAAEATNRLGSPCRLKTTSMPPVWKQNKSLEGKTTAFLLWGGALLHFNHVSFSFKYPTALNGVGGVFILYSVVSTAFQSQPVLHNKQTKEESKIVFRSSGVLITEEQKRISI